ncbi:hypothetical protein SAMN05444162_1382 [Paenibacillaceae bacterium GAS479]|nr:hypothetical protein SAMN05444162_1382 [Paenibacillaceae bacterium GAS479]
MNWDLLERIVGKTEAAEKWNLHPNTVARYCKEKRFGRSCSKENGPSTKIRIILLSPIRLIIGGRRNPIEVHSNSRIASSSKRASSDKTQLFKTDSEFGLVPPLVVILLILITLYTVFKRSWRKDKEQPSAVKHPAACYGRFHSI